MKHWASALLALVLLFAAAPAVFAVAEPGAAPDITYCARASHIPETQWSNWEGLLSQGSDAWLSGGGFPFDGVEEALRVDDTLMESPGYAEANPEEMQRIEGDLDRAARLLEKALTRTEATLPDAAGAAKGPMALVYWYRGRAQKINGKTQEAGESTARAAALYLDHLQSCGMPTHPASGLIFDHVRALAAQGRRGAAREYLQAVLALDDNGFFRVDFEANEEELRTLLGSDATGNLLPEEYYYALDESVMYLYQRALMREGMPYVDVVWMAQQLGMENGVLNGAQFTGTLYGVPIQASARDTRAAGVAGTLTLAREPFVQGEGLYLAAEDAAALLGQATSRYTTTVARDAAATVTDQVQAIGFNPLLEKNSLYPAQEQWLMGFAAVPNLQLVEEVFAELDLPEGLAMLKSDMEFLRPVCGVERGLSMAALARRAMRHDWDIADRAALLAAIERLQTAEFTVGSADGRGYALARAANLAQWGCLVGWLTPDEAAALALRAGAEAQRCFGSWEAFAADYIANAARFEPESRAAALAEQYYTTLAQPQAAWEQSLPAPAGLPPEAMAPQADVQAQNRSLLLAGLGGAGAGALAFWCIRKRRKSA